MKRKIFFFVPFFFLLQFNIPFSSAQQFEGIIRAEYFVAENNSIVFLEWFFAPGMVALDMRQDSVRSPVKPSTRFIMKKDSVDMKILSTMADGKLYYSLMSEKDIRAGEGFTFNGFETVKTEEFSVFLNHNCRKLFSKTNSIKSTCWVAEDLVTNVIDYSRFLKSDYDILALRNWGISGFPLKSVTTTLEGDLISTMLVTEVISLKCNSSEFSIPPGAEEWKDR